MPWSGNEIERGVHACHIYHNWAERRDVTVPFVRRGLEQHEHCIVVSDEATFADWRREFEPAPAPPAGSPAPGATSRPWRSRPSRWSGRSSP